jgi:hypothetical protein
VRYHFNIVLDLHEPRLHGAVFERWQYQLICLSACTIPTAKTTAGWNCRKRNGRNDIGFVFWVAFCREIDVLPQLDCYTLNFDGGCILDLPYYDHCLVTLEGVTLEPSTHGDVAATDAATTIDCLTLLCHYRSDGMRNVCNHVKVAPVNEIMLEDIRAMELHLHSIEERSMVSSTHKDA